MVDVEDTVEVKQESDKNIVFVLDVSYSMDWCVEHGEPDSLFADRCDYWWCKADSRLEVLQKSAKKFVDKIIREQGNEDITITVVTFAGSSSSSDILSNPSSGDVYELIDGLDTDAYTNINAGISTAVSLFNSDEMLDDATNILVFLSDGEPTTGYAISDNTEASLRAIENLECFAIGLGDSYSKSELEKVVGEEHVDDRIFDAGDEADLNEAFDEIAKAINSIQSTDGKVEVESTNIADIYPIKFSYKNTSGVTVSGEVTDASELAENHMSISGNNVKWEIFNYPGCSEFTLELNRQEEAEESEEPAVSVASFEENMEKSFEKLNDDKIGSEGNSEKVSGDNSKVVSGDNSKVVSGDNSEVVSGDNSEVVSGDNSKVVSGDNSKVVSGDNSEVVSGDNSEVVSGDNSEVGSGDNSKVESGDNTKVPGSGDTDLGEMANSETNPQELLKPEVETVIEDKKEEEEAQ